MTPMDDVIDIKKKMEHW